CTGLHHSNRLSRDFRITSSMKRRTAMNQIIEADCLDELRKMPSKSIDLILTDPPYGIGIATQGYVGARGRSFAPKTWDARIPCLEYFSEMRRVSKNQIIFGGNYFAHMLPPSQCWLVWWKNDGLPRLNFADCELAWTSFKRPSYVYNCRHRGGVKD